MVVQPLCMLNALNPVNHKDNDFSTSKI